MRPVMLLEPTFDKTGKLVEVTDRYEAKFHGWGVQYDEYPSGPGNFTVAIIEKSDGSVETCTPYCIRFLDSEEELRERINQALSNPLICG